MARQLIAAAGAAGLVLASAVAAANPEPGLYDARAAALGGSGVAYLDNPAAVFHNPANLQGVGRWAATVSLTGILASLSAPIDGPDDSQSTGVTVAPAFLLGGGVRVHDRVVVGLGAYVYTGYGGAYEDVDSILGTPLFDPMDQSVVLFVGELSAPVSVRLHETLDVGLAVRLPYARQDVSTHQELFPDNYRPVGQETSGFGALGVLAGLTFRPTPNLALGAAYRSKVKIGMSGVTSVRFTAGGDPFEVDTETAWYVPHMVRGGLAAWLLDRRLMLTSELRYQLHEDANEAQVFVQDFDGFEEIVAPLEWKNVLNVIVAGEYWVTPKVPVRAGYSGGNSATPRAAVQFFTTPPGLLHSVGVGVGLRLARADLDFGWTLGFGHDDVPPQEGRCQPGDRVKIGCAGEYGVFSSLIAISATFRR